jgi:hypothetical protein
MANAFRVDSDQLRSAGASVEGCCRQIESGRKSDAAAGVSSGMAGFAVVKACEAAGKASGAAFSGVAKSWRAWSAAAAGGAAGYDQVDASNEAVIRAAGADLVM